MVVSLFSCTLLSIIFIIAFIVSVKLCGGMFVAIPTAIPLVPFTKRLGYLDGRTDGSFSVSSKFGVNSTVSLLMSATISIDILLRRASV